MRARDKNKSSVFSEISIDAIIPMRVLALAWDVKRVNMATGKRADYGEASIKVLKGLEPVKQRPGMYTLTDNPLHIIQEVIDNSSDEVLAGGASRIEVTLQADGSVTVTDNGRGIPVGIA